MEQSKTCVAVLAGGASRRMGAPKLLAPFAKTTLLDHALNAALESSADETCVITGAYHEALAEHLVSHCNDSLQPALVRNHQWHEGQSTSVQAAVHFAQDHDCSALLILVADQPFVDAHHLDSLITAYREGNAQAYLASNGQRQGNPCLFDSSLFDALLALEGDEGARALLRTRNDIAVQPVVFDDDLLFEDVDTPEDLARIEELVLCD